MQALNLLQTGMQQALLPFQVQVCDNIAVVTCFGLELLNLRNARWDGLPSTPKEHNAKTMLIFHLADPGPVRLAWDFQESYLEKRIALLLSTRHSTVCLLQMGWPRNFSFNGSLFGSRLNGTQFVRVTKQVDTITFEGSVGFGSNDRVVLDPSRDEHLEAIQQFFKYFGNWLVVRECQVSWNIPM